MTHDRQADSTFTRRTMLQRTALAGGVAMFAGMSLTGCPARTNRPENWPAATKLAEDWVASGRVSGMVEMFGWSDEPAVLVGVGHDRMGDSRVADADSLYRIYSMTKPITGMAVMILIGEGKLGLDQPLGEILPRFAEMQVLNDEAGPLAPDNLELAVRPITIRQLLTHTSGLTYHTALPGPLGDAMRAKGLSPSQTGKNLPPEFATVTPVPSLEALADGLAQLPLARQPGSLWSYSPGLDLLGRVIEVVSGQSFDSFLKERIFDPCGMDSTFFTVPASEIHRLTTTYGNLNGEVLVLDPGEDSIFAEPPPFPMGGGGLVSSPRDYDRFLTMLGGRGVIDGTRVMDEAMVVLGISNLLPETAKIEGTSVEGYGFGAGGRIGWAGMDKAYGWAGSAATVGFVDPESGLRAGLFTQYRSIPALLFHLEFEPVVAQDLAFQQG